MTNASARSSFCVLPAIVALSLTLAGQHVSASPVVGILTQPLPNSTEGSYIAASYVKWVEAGGARSIPIPYDASDDMVDELWTQVHGVLFPGGGSAVPWAAKRIWAHINNQTSDRGGGGGIDCCCASPVPLWGTCLGFEYIVQLQAEVFDDGTEQSILESDFDAYNITLPLQNVHANYLYADDYIRHSVENFNITMNNHHQGISPDAFLSNPKLAGRFDITSTNVDPDGRPFVSTIEPRQNCSAAAKPLPIYGVQYHPEKNAFEYSTYPHTNIPYEVVDHSARGIAMSLHLAAKFVDMARNAESSGNCRQGCGSNLRGRGASEKVTCSSQEHGYSLVDKYPLVYSYPMIRGTQFEQVFIIPPASSWADKTGEMENKYGEVTSSQGRALF